MAPLHLTPDWREDRLTIALAAATLILGVTESLRYLTLVDLLSFPVDVLPKLLVTVLVAVGVLMHRREPAIALAAVWVAAVVQLSQNVYPMWAELMVAVVAFGAARYGNAAVVAVSGLSIPAIGFVAVAYAVLGGGVSVFSNYARTSVLAFVGVFVVIPAPWLLGLFVRLRDRATQSAERADIAEIAAHQSGELAALRADQARLARDVHDVVGHSLAVILAQAESGHFIDDTETLQTTLANIAQQARGSLQDVRGILGRLSDSPNSAMSPDPTVEVVGDLDELIEDVRSSGVVDLQSEVDGEPRPLPPELAVVAHRVLQEALTNAIKHGNPEGRVDVRRSWTDGLTLEVTNTALNGPADADPEGHGLINMRRRVEAVGGSFSVAHVPGRFTVLAWLPSAAPALAEESHA